MKTITVGEGSPRALILAGVHGDEYEPILAVHKLTKILSHQPVRGTVQLVCLVNEGAFARRSRVADDDKDVARTCPGDPNGTSTEKLAHEVSRLIRAADFMIDLHTGGIALQVAPLSGYAIHENADVLEKQRAMARALNIPIIWGSSPKLQGRTLSVARDANVPAIYAEWGGGAPLDPRGVEEYVQGCLNVLAMWDMIDGEMPASKVTRIVEESHETSGELLLAHRAPFDGFFDCHVELNQHVREGDVIGNVFEPGTDRDVEILAEQSGVIICLRAVAAVKENDSLAMVLELPGE